MIVRILSEGQFVVPDEMVDELNVLDDKISAAVESDDQDALNGALNALLDHVSEQATPVDEDLLIVSDVILPPRGTTIAELRDLFAGNGDGLIPG